MSFDLITSTTGGSLLQPLIDLGVPSALVPAIGDERYSMLDLAWVLDPSDAGMVEAWKREWTSLNLTPWKKDVSDCNYYADQFVAWLRRAHARQSFDDAGSPGDTSLAAGVLWYKPTWAAGGLHARPMLWSNTGGPLDGDQKLVVTPVESIWKVLDTVEETVSVSPMFGIGQITREEYATTDFLKW